MKAIRIGIVGFGNVGEATAASLQANAEQIRQRAGVGLQVVAVCRRTPVPTKSLPSGVCYVKDWKQIVRDSGVDLVVETMGGTEAAREVVLGALQHGKPVVTANKNLLAKHGHEIQALAARKNIPIGIEAAVAGGVPVVRAITDGMTGDRLQAVYGILNGTTNYILTEMERSGISFDEALRQAQQAGYAEPDPSSDVDGIDTRDKLCILARLAFHGWLAEDKIPTDGIRSVAAVDFCYARMLKSTIRLIAYAALGEHGLEVSVRPWLVDRRSMMAKAEGVNNAVFLVGERIGRQMFYGPGAGPRATSTAVISDLVEISRSMANGALRGRELHGFQEMKPLPLAKTFTPARWYLRLTVSDRPGILAHVAQIISKARMNIDAVLQQPNMSKDDLSFVITVEPTPEPEIRKVAKEINKLDFLLQPVLLLRMASE
jgi:homoserine dehydrogenase